MKSYPSVPALGDSPDRLDGHLWLQELLDGGHLRFSMDSDGVLQFGDRDRAFRGDVPLAYRHAVRYVRERLDREALRTAVGEPSAVTFFAEAMHRRSVDYEWHRTPHVLGFDVYDADAGQFLPPDAAEQVFERLGLDAVNALEKEVRAADFSPDPEDFPTSAWRDGPAAGLFCRTKTGDRATLRNPAVDFDADPEPLSGSADELAARYATDERLRRVAEGLDRLVVEVGFEPLFERVFESICREIHARLTHGQTAVEVGEFRSAVAARTREWHSNLD